MTDSTPQVSTANVLIWMIIADAVIQEGGLAIDAKIIYDELTQKTVPANINEAFEQMQHIRLLARQLVQTRHGEGGLDEENS